MNNLQHHLFSWEGITEQKLYILIIVYFIGTFLVLYMAPAILPHLPTRVKKAYYNCISMNITLPKHIRGSGYYNSFDPGLESKYYQNIDSCIMTFWECFHVIFHIFIGYFYNIQISAMSGILFEIFESQACNCYSFLDLFYNLVGALIGTGLKMVLN